MMVVLTSTRQGDPPTIISDKMMIIRLYGHLCLLCIKAFLTNETLRQVSCVQQAFLPEVMYSVI
jgi:hypothetical protein